MTSRIELRKLQQARPDTQAGSSGWVAGEMVANVTIHRDFLQENSGLIVLDKGMSVYASSVGGVPVPVVIHKTEPTNTGYGLILTPQDEVIFWRSTDGNAATGGVTVKAVTDIPEIFIDVVTGPRAVETRTITVTAPNSYKISGGITLPTWGDLIDRSSGNSILIALENSRVVGRYETFEEFAAAEEVLDAICRAAQGYIDGGRTDGRYLPTGWPRTRAAARKFKFGDLIDTYSWDLHRESTYAKELSGAPEALVMWPYYNRNELGVRVREDDAWILRLIFYPSNGGNVTEGTNATKVRATVTGWWKAPSITRIGTPPFTGEGELIIPVDITVQFIGPDGDVVNTVAKTIPDNIFTRQTLHIEKTTTTNTPTVRIIAGKDHERRAWLRQLTFPLSRLFGNRATEAYLVTIRKTQILNDTDDEADEQETLDNFDTINFFGHAAPISVPSIAALAGTRPNEYLTYSGTWDGSTFHQLRCRCPAWILYDVLTAERWGISLPSARIDLHSFHAASKYCQALVGSGPRWAFDGTLSGTQGDIIETLLRLMRGWLTVDTSGRYSLKVERPDTADWIVCPAVVTGGQIRYRRAISQPAVRCSYTDRLTGKGSITTGLDTATTEKVPWQDPAVTQRWADWETFRRGNLLGTVEFTVPWSHHAIASGNLVAVHDPITARIRAAGRVLDSGPTWIQLDGLPLPYWPSLVATAELRQQARNAVLDPATWGFVTIKPAGVSVRVQAVDGGFTTHSITEISWLPGGHPSQNRVYLAGTFSIPDGRPAWAINVTIQPTYWRVQSVTEGTGGREFAVVATRWIPGMHAHVETGTDLPAAPTKWTPECGTALSQFRGHWDDLNQRYPKAGSGPYDNGGTFDDLVTSCVS